jgi:hypothetical protein
MLARKILLAIIAIIFIVPVHAQNTADKLAGQKKQAEADSLKALEYNQLLPIWGEKVVKKGFKLPKSAGVSVQYIYQKSDILIENLMVGFNHQPMQNIDEIVRINNATATSSGANVRPDIWLFPFLNIYGILAKSHTSTAIDAGLWLPDSAGWHQAGSFSTKAEFDATTFGFGITPTIGVNGYFLILDANFTWTDIAELSKPAFIFILGPRLGKNFTFRQPERQLAVWIGGFRVQMSNGTEGSLNFTDLFSIGDWQQKVDAGYDKLETNTQKVDAWWNGLTPIEQKNPLNEAKYASAQRALGAYGKVLDGASTLVAGAQDGSVQYSLDKRPKDKWNFIIGSQFQLNRSWMLRAEYGFLSSRQQVILGLQYRFNL